MQIKLEDIGKGDYLSKMKKLYKMNYRNVKGEKKVYSYYITLTKEEIKQAGLDPDKELKIKIESKEIKISQ